MATPLEEHPAQDSRSPASHGYSGDDAPVLAATDDVDTDYIHPQSQVLFGACPWIEKIPIFGQACRAFGPKPTISLGLCYFLCKGIADQMISYARFAMFVKRFGINATRYQRLANISTMGWSIKALTAMLCDAFACFGYTKRWYMFISCIIGAVFALVYGLLPAKPSSANTAAAFVFLCSYGKANVDILSEGHYSRMMRAHPKNGPALVSWIWVWIMLGAIIASGIQGPLSDANLMQVGVYISAGLQFITGIIFLFNWYEERKNRLERNDDAVFLYNEAKKERERLGLVDEPVKDLHPENEYSVEPAEDALDDDINEDADDAGVELPEPVPCLCGVFEFNKEVAVRNWRIFVYSIVMTCAVVIMTCGNILADTLGLLIICVIVSVVCCITSFWALPLVIAKANVFGYLQMVVYLQLPGATDTYYMADEMCAPDGPHFSYTFYNTVSAVIGNVAGLAGVSAFNYIFARHSYRLTFIITTLVQILASIFDIIMVKHWNLYIGIPYHAMYILGDAIVYQVCYMLAWMPMVVLLSRLCPRGSESVVYALMAGFSNLGQSTSSAVGAIIMEYGWTIDSESTPCDFDNIPWLLFVGHICLPLLVIPLTLLIPSARICDDLDVDGKAIKEEIIVDAKLDQTAVERQIKREEPVNDSSEEK